MKQLPISIRLTLAVVFVLAGTPGAGAPPAAAAAATAVPTAAEGGDLLAFQLVTAGGTAGAGAGWALLGRQLFWTDDGGAHWRDLTPRSLGAAEIRAASFVDPQHGWVVTTAPAPSGILSYTLARTADGGQTWQSAPLALFAADEAAGMAGEVYLQFIDAGMGWLEVKQATSSNFNVGTLFKTVDGGAQWTRLSLPTGAPAHFSSAQNGEIDATDSGWGRYATHDGGNTWTPQSGPSAFKAAGAKGLSGLSMATTSDGWAESAKGKCDAGMCTLTKQLLGTADGGQTWQAVGLPGGQPALTQTFAQPSAPAAPQDSGGLWETYIGQGFDFCDPVNGLPTLADMETWYTNSPYGVWGLYLGGVSNHGLCGALTQNFVTQLAQEGWRFIPTWVGLQAPCTNFIHQMSSDPAIAYSQGVTEADQAITAAQSLGLTLSDGSGTMINYDVEYFTEPTGQTTCLQAVQAFISGWSGELRAHADKAGAYGAPCGDNSESLSALAAIPNVPDMIWIAAWSFHPKFDPNAAVLGMPCLSDSLWTTHQRLHQYSGGHNETWGGVTFNIDSDVMDATVAQVPVNCVPTFGQVGLFTDWYFGSQCVLLGAGQYPTPASIVLPPNSISSLRVGPYTAVTACQGQFYATPCQTFTADAADLTSQPIGNDMISSVQVSITIALTNHLYFPITWVGAGTSLSTR